jgi:hypothetical protein
MKHSSNFSNLKVKTNLSGKILIVSIRARSLRQTTVQALLNGGAWTTWPTSQGPVNVQDCGCWPKCFSSRETSTCGW